MFLLNSWIKGLNNWQLRRISFEKSKVILFLFNVGLINLQSFIPSEVNHLPKAVIHTLDLHKKYHLPFDGYCNPLKSMDFTVLHILSAIVRNKKRHFLPPDI